MLPSDALGHRARALGADQVEWREPASSSSSSEAAPPAGEHDRADGRDQQQERGDLEREQEAREQQVADVGGRAERARPRSVGGAIAADRLQARAEQRDQQLDQQRSTGDRPAEAQARGGRPASPAPPAARLPASPRRCRRRRRRRTRTAPSPRPRRRRPARRRRTPRAAAGTAPRARPGGRRARARCRTGRAGRPRRPRPRSRRSRR